MMLGKNSYINQTIKRVPEQSIGVELGVWRGESSEVFLQKAKFLHLVDSWSVQPYTESSEWESFDQYLNRYSTLVKSKKEEDFQKYYYSVYEDVVKKFKDKPVKIHRMKTIEFFQQFKEKVDWVYVDADHSFEGCFQDLVSSLSILAPGGKILGDDYQDRTPGVKEAVNTFIKVTGLPFNNFYKSQYEIICL